MAAALSGPAGILDRLISSLPDSPFRNIEPALRAEPLSNEAMLTRLSEVTPHFQLRPHYDCASLAALIGRAAGKAKYGSLRKTLLRDKQNQVAGWYLYHSKPDALAEVLQIAARQDCQLDVVAHLSADAKSHGALAVVGRLEPGLAEPLANRFCLMFRRKCTMLVHSRFPEILCAIHSGRAFISRLEGEWCLRFA